MNIIRLLCCCRIPIKGDAPDYKLLQSYDERPILDREPPTPLPSMVTRETVYASPFVSIQVVTGGDDSKQKDQGAAEKCIRGEPKRKNVSVSTDPLKPEPVPLEGGTVALPWSRFQ